LLALGGLAAVRLPAAPPAAHAPGQSRLDAMRDGLRAAVRSDLIWPVLLANLAVGVLYVGAFLVLLPLIVRDGYAGGSVELSLVSFGFWGGTIAATLAQIRLGALRRPGRAIMVALALGAGLPGAMARAGSVSLCFYHRLVLLQR